MSAGWMGAWLLWWTWYAAELRAAAFSIEFWERYNTPSFNLLHSYAMRESPFMRRIRVDDEPSL